MANAADLAQGVLPLVDRMVVLRIDAQEHPPFLRPGELVEIPLALRAGKDARALHAQHAPLPVAGLDERLELALRVAPVQEFVDQFAVDLARTVVAHPDFLELAQAQEQAEIGDILLVALVGVGSDEPVVPRLADHELRDQRAQNTHGPARERPDLDGQAHARSKGAHRLGEVFRVGGKPAQAVPVPVLLHAAEHAVRAMQIQARIGAVVCDVRLWDARLQCRVHGIDLGTAKRYAPQQCSPHD